jgi:hypothetical protein
MDDQSDEELLAELGVEIPVKTKQAHTPREERVIAGFEDILRFYDTHGQPPLHGENNDIFERIYAVRLDRLRALDEFHALLAPLDIHGLLTAGFAASSAPAIENLADEDILAELGVATTSDNSITNLRHVRPYEEKRAAEEIANRSPCKDFKEFKPIFDQITTDITSRVRQTRRFGENAEIKQGEVFILDGVTCLVAHVGDEFRAPNGEWDARLRVIFANRTESNLLRRSIQRALYKDEAGRRVTEPAAGPLFADKAEDGDVETGTIYVLRSRSEHPDIASRREVIHKIGVTGGDVKARIANAQNEATYLLAAADVVAEYQLYNINRAKLEHLIHRVLTPARLDLSIPDRFGRSVQPREWYQVPLHVIDEVVEKVRNGTITEFEYDPTTASLRLRD